MSHLPSPRIIGSSDGIGKYSLNINAWWKKFYNMISPKFLPLKHIIWCINTVYIYIYIIICMMKNMSFIICKYVIMHMFTNVLTYVPLDCHIQFHTITLKNKMTKSPCSFDFGPSFYHNNNNKNSPFCNSKPIVFLGGGLFIYPREPQHTPGVYPRHRPNLQMKGIPS